MLSTEAFAEWSKENVVLFLHNTSRVKDEPFPDLLREKGGNGFPTVTYLDADGRPLKQLAFPTELSTMQEGLAELQRWQELKAAAKTDPSKRKELFMLEVDNRMLTAGEARTLLEEIELTDQERAGLEPKLVDLEFNEILRATKPEQRAAAGGKFYAMLEADRVPQSRQITTFWQYIFEHAAAEQDVEKYAKALAEMKRRHADDRRLQRYLPAIEAGLEKLRKGSR